jgi:hypothetical protein
MLAMSEINGMERDRPAAPLRQQRHQLPGGEFLRQQPVRRVADARTRKRRRADDLGAVGLQISRDAHVLPIVLGTQELLRVLRRNFGINDSIVGRQIARTRQLGAAVGSPETGRVSDEDALQNADLANHQVAVGEIAEPHRNTQAARIHAAVARSVGSEYNRPAFSKMICAGFSKDIALFVPVAQRRMPDEPSQLSERIGSKPRQ